MAIENLGVGSGYSDQPTKTLMTEDTMNVQALLGKSANTDFLREMIGRAGLTKLCNEMGGFLSGHLYAMFSALRERGEPRASQVV